MTPCHIFWRAIWERTSQTDYQMNKKTDWSLNLKKSWAPVKDKTDWLQSVTERIIRMPGY